MAQQNRAVYQKVNTINWSANQLENIGSPKPALAKVGAELSRNGGSIKKVYT